MSVEEFKSQIEALRTEYRAQLPAKRDELDRLWRGLTSGALKPDRVVELRRALHTLAGSARTFGVAGVSEAAAAAESYLEPFCSRSAIPGPAEQSEFRRLLDALKQVPS